MGLRLLIIFLLIYSSISAGEGEFIPSVTASSVDNRIQILDAKTPVSLVYNQDVQAYIDVYTVRRREHLSRILGRAELYFPLFEEMLDKYGLPLELKYLAVVESALDPRAKSTSGAMGLWQFLFQASRMFNLQVTSYMDERSDPVKSTEAACRYLKYLYDNLHDWHLVLAAYNGGIATVQEAIAKSGGERDYWKIRKFLSAETRSYVPAFIAVNYVMNHHGLYGISAADAPFRYDDLGFVYVDKSVSFNQLSASIDVSVDLLRLLNPVFTLDYIPVVTDAVLIVIPQNKVLQYLNLRNQLKEEKAPPVANIRTIGDVSGREKILHTVQPGEFFHKIAMDYRVRVEDVQHWNRLTSRHLNAGQQLVIWYKEEMSPWFFVRKERVFIASDHAILSH
jgi:membrane-bound lytic murein transglycosylase D